MSDALVLRPATELLALLARRAVGVVEVTEAFLKRIERLDPRINSYTTVTVEAALRNARRLDRVRGRRGPLHGLPIRMKDLNSPHSATNRSAAKRGGSGGERRGITKPW